MKSFVCIIFIYSIFYISGCGKNDEKDYEDTRTYNEKTAPMDTGIKTNDTVSNSRINSSQTLPADFPSDIPVYFNSKILASSSGTNPMVTLETDDNVKDVVDFYNTGMKKNGYSSDSFNDKLSDQGFTLLNYSKEGKQYTISCMYNAAKAKTMITIQTKSGKK